MPSKTKTSTRVTSYTKNLAKSFGYALGDVFKEYNPVVFNMSKEVAESSKELYQGIKSFAFEKSSTTEGLLGDAKGFVDSAWKNALDDIKSGKWYNKERAEALEGDIAKSLGFDFDFNFDFDEDWGDDFDSTDSAVMSAETESTKQVVGAMDVVGSAVANSVNRTTAESANYIVASSNRASKALYDLNVKGFTNVTNAIIAVNNTLGSIGQLGEPLTAHMQNSAVFFTNTTAKLDSIHQTLEKIAANTEKVPVSKNKLSNRNSVGIDDLFTDDGLDFNSMKSMIKDSFKDNKELGTMALNAIKSFKGTKNISVMQFATTMMTKALIPQMFKDAMKRFNTDLKESMQAVFIQTRNRLHGRGGSNSKVIDGGIIDMLLGMVIPDSNNSLKFNHGNYEKGAVAWDGKSRKALMEVIPDTLLAIYSAISGAPLMTYDYEKGTYVTKKNIRSQWSIEKSRYRSEAGGEFREKALRDAKLGRFEDASNKDVYHYINLYFNKAFNTGSNDYYNADTVEKNFYSLLGLKNVSSSDKKAIDEAIKIITKELKRPEIQKRFTINNQRKREQLANQMDSIGQDDIKHILDNGFKRGNGGSIGQLNNITRRLTDLSHTFFRLATDRLNKIYGTLLKIEKNTSNGSGNKSRRRNTGGVGKKGVIHNENDTTEKKSNVTELLEFDDIYKDQDYDDEYQDKEEIEEDPKYKKDSLSKKLLSFLFSKNKNGDTGLMELYKRPFNAVVHLMNTITDGINKVFFGENDKDKDSLANKFKAKFEKIFDPVKNWFKGFWEDTSKYLNKAGRWAGNHLIGKERMAALGYGEVTPGVTDNGNNSRGRRVTRTGIAAVSEGELIIPADLNPYYNGKSNRRQQARDEARARRKFFGSYAPGDKSVGQDPDNSIDNSALGYILRFLMATKDGAIDKYTQFKNKASGKFNDSNVISDKMKAVTNALFKELGATRGAAGAGAIIGAGASLFTGGLIGPLFGASLGAAAGLVVNSNTIQNVLFGKTINKETGEVEGGLLSKEVANFMKNQVPGMAKGGLFGATAGLFMGSPLLGAMVGASVSYAKNSEGFKKYLFGDVEYDEEGNVTGRSGALISKKMQEQVKRAVPNIGIGALAGLVTGPFGPIGNMAFGAGLGLLTSTDSFHKYLFGDPDKKTKDGKPDKGLLGKVSDKLLKNVNATFQNIFNGIRGWSSRLLTNTTRFIKEALSGLKERGKNSFIGRAIGGVGRGIVRGVGKLTGGAVDLTGGVFSAVNNGISRRNANRGYDVYDKNLGRNLTAKEKADAVRNGDKRFKNSRFATFYEALGGYEDEAGLQNILSQLEDAKYDSTKAQELMSRYNLKKSDISSAISQVKSQLKYVNSDEGKRDKSVTLVEKIEGWTEKIYNILKSEGKIGALTGDSENGNQSSATLKDSKDKDANYIVTEDGIIKSDLNEDTGVQEYDRSDPGTNEALKNAEKKRENLDILAKASTSLSDKFSSLFVDDDEDKEPSFFSKLKDMMGGVVTKIIAGVKLVAGGWLVYNLFKGKLDGMMSKLGVGKVAKGNTGGGSTITSAMVTDSDGNVSNVKLQTDRKGVPIVDENGNYLDENGNVVDGTVDKSTIKSHTSNAQKTFSEQIGKNVVSGALHGKKGTLALGNNVVARVALGKKGSKLLNTAGKNLVNKSKVVNKGASKLIQTGNSVANVAKEQLKEKSATLIGKLAQALKKVPLLKDFAEGMEEFGKGLTKELDTAIEKGGKEAAEKGLKSAARLVIAVQIACVVADCFEGWQDAANTWQMKPEDLTTGHKVVSAIINATKNFIPYIGSFIPLKLLGKITGQIFCKLHLFGDMTWEEMQSAQAKAIEEAHEAGFDNYTDYLKADKSEGGLGQYTFSEKVSNKFKSIFNRNKTKTSSSSELSAEGSKIADRHNKINRQNRKAMRELNKRYVKEQEELASAGGSGFISQLDSRYNGISLGGKSIASNGCAPATAVMSMGGSMGSAINIARRYQTQGGTDLAFFADYARNNGGQATYYPGVGGGAAGMDIVNSIASGTPTVLMGRDMNNTSKSHSPFGPRNHYVVAKGFDRGGNVIIDDPENKGTKKYSANILGNVSYGVGMSGSGSGSRRRKVRPKRRINHNYTIGQLIGGAAGGWADIKDIYLADLMLWSPISVDEMNEWISRLCPGTPFEGRGDVFIEAANQSGLDPRYILAHAGNESTYGTSNQAKTKHNYFGIGAFDTNPSAAYSMGDGLADGIINGAIWIRDHYYAHGQRSIYKMRFNNKVHEYCTSRTQHESIAKTIANGPANTSLTVIDQLEPGDHGNTNVYTKEASNFSQYDDRGNKLRPGYVNINGKIINTNSSGNRGSQSDDRGFKLNDGYSNINGQIVKNAAINTRPNPESYGTSNSSNSTSGTSDSPKMGLGDRLSAIMEVISNAFTSGFNGGKKESSSSKSSSSSTGAPSEGVVVGYDDLGNPIYGADSVELSGNSVTDRFVEAAASQLGYKEGPGNNQTKFGADIGQNFASWCASFVSWAAKEATKKDGKYDSDAMSKILRGSGTASTSALYERFKNASAVSSTPQKGDIVLYKTGTYEPKSHVGIVESYDGSTLTTIEGNTSGVDINGNKADGVVSRKTFTPSDSRWKAITGFGRPDWPALDNFFGGENLSDRGYSSSRDGGVGAKSIGPSTSKTVTASSGEKIVVDNPYTGSNAITKSNPLSNLPSPTQIAQERFNNSPIMTGQTTFLDAMHSDPVFGAKGSGLVSYSDYVSRRSGGSSGVLLGSRVGSSVYGSNPTGVYVPKKRSRKFIGESGRKVYKNNRVDYQAMAAMSGGASGVMDNEAVITLLKGIYEYMASINENTGEAGWMRSSIDGTTNALSKTANGIRGMAAASSAAMNNNGPGKFGEVDDSVKELAKKMRSITA